jgi:hypothetical protein
LSIFDCPYVACYSGLSIFEWNFCVKHGYIQLSVPNLIIITTGKLIPKSL